jgi:transcriptional regulator with XRE-family HTH domain
MTKEEWRILGTRLRQVRRRQDLTSEELAAKAGTTRVTISALENTRKPRISFDVVMRVASVLGISLDYLAGRKDDERVRREPAAVELVGA